MIESEPESTSAGEPRLHRRRRHRSSRHRLKKRLRKWALYLFVALVTAITAYLALVWNAVLQRRPSPPPRRIGMVLTTVPRSADCNPDGPS